MEVVLIGGENNYQAEVVLREELARLTKLEPRLELVSYYADEIASLREISALAGAVGLFAQAEAVLLRDLLSNGRAELRDQLLDYLERQLISKQSGGEFNGQVKLLLFESGHIDRRSKLYKFLQKRFTIKEFAAATELDKQRQIQTFFKQSGLKMPMGLERQLLKRLLPLSPRQLASELDKIRLLLEFEGRTELSEGDLDLCTSDIAEEIWELFSLAATNKPAAFELFENLWRRDVHFSQMIGFLASQLRQLLHYYYLPESMNPYLKRKISALVSKIPRAKLHLLLTKLCDLDLALKSGELEPRAGLVLYLTIV